MNFVDQLINKKIKFRPIPQWGRYLRKQWENTFANHLSEDEKKSIYLNTRGGYLWHLFSYNSRERLDRDAANVAFDNEAKGACFVFYQHTNDAILIEDASLLKVEDLQGKRDFYTDDMYIMDKNGEWTYVITHETGWCGPYFCRQSDGINTMERTGKEMQIKLTSVFVDDQDKAHKFYTEVLGFVTKRDIPIGGAKWLTVVSPEEPDGVELLLEPNGNPAATAYQKGIFDQGIPATAFLVDDVQKEFERLKALGVAFMKEPTMAGEVILAIFNDTCGNLIQIYQVHAT